MLAILLIAIIGISVVLGFKLGQLWYLDNYKQCRCSQVKVSVDGPAIVDGQTVYFNYINKTETDYWQEKG